jgi:tetratricopeptide (TPR) repeat protein
LRATGHEDDVRRSHAHYYAELAETARLRLDRAESVDVPVEDENILAALRWTSERRERDLHLRLVVASARLWSITGQLSEADSWLQPAVAMAAEAPPALCASILTAASTVAGRVGDSSRATALATAAWDLCRASGDRRGVATALLAAMTAAGRAGDMERRDALLNQLHQEAEEVADPALRCEALQVFAAAVGSAGDHERARMLAEESLAIARANDLELITGQSLCHLGVIAVRAGRPSEAEEPLEQSLAIAQKLGYREAAAYSLSGLASLAVAEDDLLRAARLLSAADALFDEIGTTRLPFISDLDATSRAAIRHATGEQGFARARDEARDSTFDQLVALGPGVPSDRDTLIGATGSDRRIIANRDEPPGP